MMRLIYLPVALAVTLIAGLVPAAGATAAAGPAGPQQGAAGSPPGGTQLWQSDYAGGETQGWNSPGAVAVSPGGSTVFVTGQSEDSAGEQNGATVAYDAATGAQLWSALYPGRGEGNASAGAIAVSPDGSAVYVTGSSAQDNGSPQATTVAYDAATGAQLWVASYRGSGSASARSVAVSPDGRELVVGGWTDNGKAHSVEHFLTLAYNAASGTLAWHRRQWWPVNQDSMVNSVAVSPDGTTVFATGQRYGKAGLRQFATVAYNTATGARRWLRSFGTTAGDSGAGSAVASPDGSTVFISGLAGSSLNGGQVATLAYNAATGALRWSARFTASTFAGPAVVSPDGSMLYVTGRGPGPSGEWGSFTTVAYQASTGAVQWQASYSSPGGETVTQPTAMALSPSGSAVYVTGEKSVPSEESNEYLTVAFDAATGARLWATEDSNAQVPAAIAAGSDGSVFVTGDDVSGRFAVYATVAYQG